MLKKICKGIGLFLAAALLSFFGWVGFIFWPSHYVAPILMYHNIDEFAAKSRLSVEPGSFAKQMEFLARNKYNVVSLEQMAEYIKLKNIPKKSIAITFDDGYLNNFTVAYPVLKKYSFPATIFVIVGEVGKPGFMNYNQMKAMIKDNITIGSHTISHPDLKSLDHGSLRKELYESKKILEKNLNAAVNTLSYPMGCFNSNVRQAAKEAGYKVCAATGPGKKFANDDIFALKRLRIAQTSDNAMLFWLQASGFYMYIKEHRDSD